MVKRVSIIIAASLIIYSWYTYPRSFSSLVTLTSGEKISVMGCAYNTGLNLDTESSNQLKSFFKEYKYKRAIINDTPLGAVCSLKFGSGDYISFYGSKDSLFINGTRYFIDNSLVIKINDYLHKKGFKGVVL